MHHSAFILRHAAGTLLLGLLPALSLAQTQNTTYHYQYDAVGNLTQITDPLGRITNQSKPSMLARGVTTRRLRAYLTVIFL
jgi:YD repeat-containing protein